MYYFTAAGNGAALTLNQRPLVLDFVRIQRDTRVIEKTRRLPPKPKLDSQAAASRSARLPSLPERAPPALAPPDVRVPGFVPQLDGGFGAFGFAGNREVVPLARISPVYPLRAERRRIEGWVRVGFTIDEDGGVIAPLVLEAEPQEIFDRAALNAISRWRYQPQLIDGRAVRRSGVEVIVRFQLPE